LGGLESTLLKLIVTPALITFATLIGRRFGQAIAGWLIAFPWTSAPVSFFLALDHGVAFAAAAARGSIAAVAAECVFALAYAHVRRGWPLSLAVASVSYVVAALAMQFVGLDPIPLAALMAALLLVTSRMLPRGAPQVREAEAPPAWDLPARIAVATSIVLVITTVAPALGPYGSAVAASYPLFASILAVFAERHAGHDAAINVMRGLAAGLFGFMTFFVVIALALGPLGLIAFAIAAVATLIVQAASLAVLRRPA
jgi:hypothetical protein